MNFFRHSRQGAGRIERSVEFVLHRNKFMLAIPVKPVKKLVGVPLNWIELHLKYTNQEQSVERRWVEHVVAFQGNDWRAKKG